MFADILIKSDALLEDAAKERAENLPRAERNQVSFRHAKAVDVLLVDLPRTFPNQALCAPHGPYHEQVRDILRAFDLLRPDIGYVQGMSFVAVMLSIHLEPLEAFMCLGNLLNRPFFSALYTMDRHLV